MSNFLKILDELNETKSLKKVDVKNTEKKMEQEVSDTIGNSEIDFLNNFIKKGQKIDGKVVKSVDSLIKKYKAKVGSSKIRNDPNFLMLAPILSAMQNELTK